MRTVHLRLQLAASWEVYLFNCYIFFFLDTDPGVMIGATSLQITSYDFRVVRTHWLPLFWLLWDHSIIPNVWPKPFTTQSWKDALQRRIAMLLFCCCYWWWWWWYTHVCAMMYTCKCTSMSLSGSGHMCRDQRRTSGGFLFFYLIVLNQNSLSQSLGWLVKSTTLESRPHNHGWLFTWLLGILNQAFIFTHEALSTLSHLSPLLWYLNQFTVTTMPNTFAC